MQALLLPLAGEWYALDLIAVREVVPMPPVRRLPGTPRMVYGVVNLRGDVVPVIDTGELLGLGRHEGARYLAVAETPDGPAGLTADDVPERVELKPPASPARLPGAVGRFAAAGRVATLLDLADLLDPERIRDF